MRFYYAPGSCSLASHAALEQTGERFEAIRVVLANGDQRRAEYLSVNPRGRVPALLAEARVVTETIAIISYLARKFPETALLPLENPILLARAYELMSWFATSLHVAVAQIWRTERFTTDVGAKAAVQLDGLSSLVRGYAELETAMQNEWLLGGIYSAVDPYAFVFWRWGERLGMDMASYRSWAAHSQRVLMQPSVRRALDREAQQ